ncbi:vacuolar (H+)-ATPase G subunit domain-containing protein [Ditylenchus destructor]|uniref:V-type proton ATPase subunit G n=1 Tax=Ditylenchus destructor TaxID=166010 RepID=A0AAD4N109_9BILA|nr:vacuolar (H+)-ATPase G subunit domain-containing protein [Ditylenchus destructor]
MPSYCRRRRENEHVSAVGVGVTANYGVRLLLEAEQKATQKVENARKKRKEKLRRARHEAKIEVDLLKQRRQSTYQQLLDEVSAEQKALEQQIAKETEEKLKSINEMVCNNRNTVCGF